MPEPGFVARLRRASQLWWVTPAGAVLLVTPLSLFVAVRISADDYRSFYNTPRALTNSQAALFAIGAAVLIIGTLLPSAISRVNVTRSRTRWALPADQLRVLVKAENICFWLTILGYIFFALIGAARGATPALLIGAVTSQDNNSGSIEDLFKPVAGVTSLTQFGIAYVVIAALLLQQRHDARLWRRIGLILFLGLLRAYLITERLALLELVVPLLVLGATYRAQLRRPGRWSFIPFAPVFAFPMLLVVFGAFEYSRSWQFYKSHTSLPFPEFVVNRLAGYYATSYNNGALQLDHLGIAARLPYSSIEALWTAPGIAQLDLYKRITGVEGNTRFVDTLTHYGNIEFTNPGGLAQPYVDFGTVGGMIFFLVLGVIVGLLFRSWQSRLPTGLLIYPVMMTGLLELPRYLYFTQGRVLPALGFLGVTAAMMNRASRLTERGVPVRSRPGRRSDAARIKAASSARSAVIG